MPTVEQQSNIARSITGSKLETNLIIAGVKGIEESKKETVCSLIETMIKKYDLSFDKAFPYIQDGFNNISSDYNIDPAILFWVYMDWLKQKNNS